MWKKILKKATSFFKKEKQKEKQKEKRVAPVVTKKNKNYSIKTIKQQVKEHQKTDFGKKN